MSKKDDNIITFVGDSFVEQVQRLVKEKKLSYIDAVVHWCNIKGLEYEVGAELVNKSSLLKTMIEEEADKLNCLKEKSNRLPI